ncbi:MAG TPA: UDP-N-acetylglucosamine 2-epimerase (non-hydrolyzing) [Gemmatimonadaceae bacterium]|nr:UDP-N-acetylglucosamine 2-epimerase (non-hydrolyzing) [Gemmatimonadaceae bacterium]
MTVVGARPQFIKAALVSRALEKRGVREFMVHTGQHYDYGMSERFFEELGMRPADVNLGVASGGHGAQTGRMLEAVEGELEKVKPDRVLVYGDTNSTLAGALAAAKLHIPVDHVEAGLRSFDRDMPEELNRILTDQLSDLLFCPTPTAVRQLECEGIRNGVVFVGDVMLDLAMLSRSRAESTPLPPGVPNEDYFLVTLHRPSNTDGEQRLREIIGALTDIAETVGPVVLPAHPRLRRRLGEMQIDHGPIQLLEPAGYLLTQRLIMRARAVITDSGGVQKEAFFHGTPCVTVRDSTEWTETLHDGANVLMGESVARLVETARERRAKRSLDDAGLRLFGGGAAADRIAESILQAGNSRRRWRRS